MAKDYAKHHAHSKRRRPTHPGHRFRRVIICLLALLITGLTLGGYLYKTKKVYLFYWVTHAQSFIKPKQTPVKATAQSKKTEPEIHFHFYDELPNMEVKEQITESPAPTSSHLTYCLQLGLFKNKSAASEQRISLLFLGLDVDLIQTPQGYALRSGNYETIAQAKKIQSQLKRKGIDSLIKEK